jgi:osmotically-inducible protein OsmY
MEHEGGGSSIEVWLAQDEEPALERAFQERVREEMRWEGGLDASGIAIEARDRVITLLGSVRTYPEKVAAERAAERVPHVQQVISRLRVDLPPGHARPDAVLLEEVTRVLGWDTLVPAGRVRATVVDGCVTLLGEVDWEYQRVAAHQAVIPLIGVTAVDNRITIRPKWVTGQLQPEVTAAVRRHRELHTRHVNVDTQRGVVVLRGHVPSLAERTAVEQAVWKVPGVMGVVNELTIDR